MLAALTLTNCTKDAAEDNVIVNNGKGFSFTANIDGVGDTKATLEGVKTVWEAGDQIGLGGSIDNMQENKNVQLLPFDFVAGNTFNNADASYAEAQTFYAIYPFTANSSGFSGIYPADHASRANQTTVYYVVGSKGTATQNGASAAHIPANSPMYYVSADAVAPAALAVQLHHTTSLMKFTVVNGEDAALTVKSLKLTVPSTIKICGTYYMNVATGELISSGANYTYSTQTINVENAPALAKGESFDVYMAVAPFELAANDAISMVVTSADGKTCTIEKKMAAAIAFEAGKINTATVNFVKDVVADAPMTVSELVAKINAGTTTFSGQKVQGIVAAFAKDSNQNISFGTVLLTDNTGELNSAVKFYDTAATSLINAEDLTVGDELLINLSNATAAARGGATQITGVLAADVEDLISYENVIVAKEVTIADYNANALAYDNLYLKFVDVTPAAATVGKTATEALTFTQNGNDLTVYNRGQWTAGKDIVIANLTGNLYGFGQYYNAPQVVPMAASDLAAFGDPCEFSATKVSFTAEGGSEVVTATLTEGYALGTVTSDAAWLTVIPSTDGIVISAVANTTTEPRTATVSVPVTKGGTVVVTKTIEVSQKAAGDTTVESTAEFVFSTMGYANSADVASVTVEDITIALDKGSNTNGPKYYTTGASLRVYPNNTMTFTGATITKIEITYTQNDSAKGVCSLTATIGAFDGSDWNGGEMTWTGEAASVPFTVASTKNGALRIAKIVVTYTK